MRRFIRRKEQVSGGTGFLEGGRRFHGGAQVYEKGGVFEYFHLSIFLF